MKKAEHVTYSPEFTMQDIIDVKAHLGHRVSRVHPKMKASVFGSKNGIAIIDVTKIYSGLTKALDVLYKLSKSKDRIKVLFVSTMPQVATLIKDYATKCDQFYVNDRWLGGMLTNWYTVSKSIKTLNSYNKLLEDGANGLSKKELVVLTKKRDKLIQSFGGIMNMGGRPDVVVVMNTIKDHLAVQESNAVGIPVVAVVDTNSNADNVSYPIPGNDDGIQAVEFYLKQICDAIMLGKHEFAKKKHGINVSDLMNSKKDANTLSSEVVK